PATIAEYDLDGAGTLNVSGDEDIGYSGEYARFSQGGTSTNTVAGNLYLGYSSGASASYALEGVTAADDSVLSVMQNAYIGGNTLASGVSTFFSIVSGTATIAGTLTVGNNLANIIADGGN